MFSFKVRFNSFKVRVSASVSFSFSFRVRFGVRFALAPSVTILGNDH